MKLKKILSVGSAMVIASSMLVGCSSNNIEKIMVGKRKVVEKIVIALLTNGHVLIEDVPGVGKTQCVSALARSVDGSFKRIQFTPDVMASDITGFTMYLNMKIIIRKDSICKTIIKQMKWQLAVFQNCFLNLRFLQ